MRKQQMTAIYEQQTPEYYVGFVPHKSGTWIIELDEVMTDVRQFSGAIQALRNATENDEVEINLQSCGGSVDAGDAFIHALRKCVAPIHIIATGNVSSMATFVLLEADSFELSEGFSALIHCGGVRDGGTTNEFRASAMFHLDSMERLMRRGYQGFLSEQEIDDVINGKDIWLDASQWVERAVARSELFKSLNESNENKDSEDIPEELLEKLTKPLPELSFTGIDGAFDSFGEEVGKIQENKTVPDRRKTRSKVAAPSRDSSII
jgi:ATP-dependent protease ClpP protease subunit